MVKMKLDHRGARLRGGWDVGGDDGSWVMGWVWVREKGIIWVMGGGSDDNEWWMEDSREWGFVRELRRWNLVYAPGVLYFFLLVNKKIFSV